MKNKFNTFEHFFQKYNFFKRDLSIELNKMHGFHRMSALSDEGILPCVRGKYYTNNKLLNDDCKYSVKLVKDYPSVCNNCTKITCELCSNYNPYEDYNMDYKICLSSKELKDWITNYKHESKCNNLKFFYYKYFSANTYGKLLVTPKGYCIELYFEDAEGKKVYYESIKIGKNMPSFLFTKSKYLKITEILEIDKFVKLIENEFSLQLKFKYSILFDFAILTDEYFELSSLNKSGFVFYGLRAYFPKNEIVFDEYND